MFMPNPYLFNAGDEVICPSCRKNVFLNGDVLITKAKYLLICSLCRAYVKCEKLKKVNKSEVKECQKEKS